MALTTPDVVKIDIDFDTNTKKVVYEIDKLTKHISKEMRRNQKAAEKMGKGLGTVFKNFANSRDSLTNLKKLTSELDEIQFGLDAIRKRKEQHLDLLKEAAAAPKDSQLQKDKQKRADDFATAERVTDQEYDATKRAMEEAHRRVKESATEIADAFDIEWEDIGEALASPLKTILTGTDWDNVGENIASPLHDFLSRDAPTIAKRIGKLLTGKESWSKWADDASKGKRGDKAWGADKKGTMKGAALGSAEKVLGGLVKGLMAIGPIISAASGLFAGLAKVVLDAEAAGKEFNKQLLETTSTASFLSRHLGDSAAATKDLQDTLAAARDGAHAFQLAQMGVSKEAGRSFISAITAEGVALDRLGKATGEAKVSSETYTKVIMQGVAFSRQFGVSLSEIATMQGQLMTDVGMSSDQVTAGFASIAEGAEAAGMEANKFFGIIRGFSSDLSLFTLRMEDVTKIMGQLGKTMDPRKMGQFLQQLNQKFSGGIVDNLKFEMMAEKGGGDKVFMADLASKFDNLSSDLKGASVSGDDIATLSKLIKQGDERGVALWKEQRKATDKHLPGEVAGPIVEAIDGLVIQNKRIMSGDRLDKASIMEKLSPFSKIEMQQAASFGMFGKRLEDLSGIQLAAAESAGIASDKEIQALRQFHNAILQGQEGLLSRMSENKLTPEDIKQLKTMNIDESKWRGKGNADELRKKFNAQGGDRMYHDSLGKDQQDLLQSATKARNFQEESADLQVSMNDKLGMITDVLMNYIFKGIELISTILRGMWGHNRDTGAEYKQGSAIAARKGGDTGLRKAWEGGHTLKQAKEKAIEENYKRAWAGLQNAGKESDDIKSRMGKEQDPGKKAELQKRLDELKPVLEMRKKYGSESDFHKDMYDLAEKEARGGVPAMMEAMEVALTGGGAAAGGGVSTSGPGPVASQAPAKTAAAVQESVVEQKATTAAVTEMQRTVANDGVKLAPTTVAGPLKDAMAESVYEGTAKALFEYFMYSGLDRTQVTNAMMNGMDGKGVAGAVMSGAAQGMNASTALAGGVVQAPGHAMGGTVTGILNGMATVQRPAPGEGWASIGAGETILPAGASGGGGATRVLLELKGDLKRFVDARVVEGAAAHDRNKRHR